jgi:3-methyladenine DNA glycosylase AlkD
MEGKSLNSIDSAAAGRRIAARIIDELHRSPMNTTVIRAVRRQFSKQLNDVDRETNLACAHELIRRAPFGRFVAYELVHYHAATMASLTELEIENLGHGIASWGDVDTFACYVSGPAWYLKRIAGQTIARWARSDDRWWRRAALVSAVPLNSPQQARSGSTAQTLAVCRMLVADRDDMVVKAMSWALRALARRDPDAVRKFLDSHKDRLAARVIREVENKLTTGLKNPRRSGPAHEPVPSAQDI